MTSQLFKLYRDLENQFKILEEERSLLRLKIVSELIKNKTDKIETEYGKFTIGKRSVWEYTEAVKKAEEKVKLMRVKEQQKKLAKESITEYLIYTFKKS